MAETAGSSGFRGPRRLLLLSTPRTASSLLVQILGLKDQPDFITSKPASYLFISAKVAMVNAGVSGEPIDQWPTDKLEEVRQMYQKCLDELEKLVQESETTGYPMFAKEHAEHFFDPFARSSFLYPLGSLASANPSWKLQIPPGIATSEHANGENTFTSGTILPDVFLRTWLPLILIRHPALAFPSYYRVRHETDGYPITGAETEISHTLLPSMTYSWSRKLYDWYTAQDTKDELLQPEETDPDFSWPIVIDSDDYETDPKSLIRLCEIIRLDPSKLKFSWEPVSNEARKGFISRMLTMHSTLLNSNGVIVRERSSQDLNIQEEAKKWRKEFGEAVGNHLVQVVKDAMPDYEYLRSRRLRLSST